MGSSNRRAQNWQPKKRVDRKIKTPASYSILSDGKDAKTREGRKRIKRLVKRKMKKYADGCELKIIYWQCNPLVIVKDGELKNKYFNDIRNEIKKYGYTDLLFVDYGKTSKREDVACLYVGGISGVGKTTLLNGALNNINMDIQIGKGSEIMKNLANLTCSSELCNLTQEYRNNLRKRAHDIIFSSHDKIILDGHFAVPIKDGNYEIPYPEEYTDYIKGLVLISADAKSIYQRRQLDIKKKERPLDTHKITAGLEKELETITYLSKKYNKKMYIVENDKKEEKGIGELKDIILDVLG